MLDLLGLPRRHKGLGADESRQIIQDCVEDFESGQLEWKISDGRLSGATCQTFEEWQGTKHVGKYLPLEFVSCLIFDSPDRDNI